MDNGIALQVMTAFMQLYFVLLGIVFSVSMVKRLIFDV